MEEEEEEKEEEEEVRRRRRGWKEEGECWNGEGSRRSKVVIKRERDSQTDK